MRITAGSADLVAGVDEVGRGPLAGPVITCAVILLRPVPDLADSKVLNAKERERLALLIRKNAVLALGAASTRTIAEINILHASMVAMARAVARLARRPGLVLVDGNRVPKGLAVPCEAIVQGDASVDCIAAASIVAKVTRDRLMARVGARWPDYGFERHAGYPTRAHKAAIVAHGPCPHHRRGFKGVLPLFEVVADLDVVA